MAARQPLRLRFPAGGDSRGFRETCNISGLIATVIIHRLATLQELQTAYSYEDLFDLLEILQVDAYNQAIAQQAQERAWQTR